MEIKAVLFGLKSLCSKFKHCSIKLLSDNQTAVAYLRNMGSTHSRDCNQITRETILWCEDRDMSLTITHLPGKLNVKADKTSREFPDDTEWSPDVDLFASQLNAKILCYVAWKPDPNAFAIDAFTLNWSVFNLVYCFPPFSVIGKVLQKLLQYQTTAILVLPERPTQFWYPRVTSMLLAPPMRINLQKTTLTLPHNASKVHPLYPKLQLIGCLVSGKHSYLTV